METKKFVINQKKFKGESQIISLRLSTELIGKFDEVSKATGRTRNEVLTAALEYAIDNLEIK